MYMPPEMTLSIIFVSPLRSTENQWLFWYWINWVSNTSPTRKFLDRMKQSKQRRCLFRIWRKFTKKKDRQTVGSHPNLPLGFPELCASSGLTDSPPSATLRKGLSIPSWPDWRFLRFGSSTKQKQTTKVCFLDMKKIHEEKG